MDAAFARAATLAQVEQEPHPIDRKSFGLRAEMIRNGKMVAKGAGLCLVLHRFILIAKGNRDCARQALAARIPTSLIDSEDGEPMRIRADDPRLR